MSTNHVDRDVLVIGAGVAGLMAAGVLRERGLRVTVADSEPVIGGRLATQPIGGGLADSGAQFFTVRTQDFQRRVDRWLAEGLAFKWSSGWSTGSDERSPADGYQRYAVRGGMNTLAKHLARELDIRLNTRITAVFPTDDGWRTEGEDGQTYTSRGLLLTPPVPESLALLDAGGARLAADERSLLEGVVYAPCLAGLFVVNGPVYLPEPGAVQRPNDPVTWIADNRRKGVSPEVTVVTVHAGPDYSRQLWDIADWDVMKMLQAALQPFLRSIADIGEAELKRWRYALPTVFYPRRTLLAAGLPPLGFAGDAFGEPRVEGAAMSGLAAGEALAARLLEAKDA